MSIVKRFLKIFKSPILTNFLNDENLNSNTTYSKQNKYNIISIKMSATIRRIQIEGIYSKCGHRKRENV